jgi:hypothetical protein
MEAKFIGDPTERGANVPEVFEAHGVTFERGKFADVPEKLQAKFEGNSHFETKGGAKAGKAPPAEAEPDPFGGLSKPQIEEALRARGVAFDPKGSKGDLLEQLRAAPAPTLPPAETPEQETAE